MTDFIKLHRQNFNFKKFIKEALHEDVGDGALASNLVALDLQYRRHEGEHILALEALATEHEQVHHDCRPAQCHLHWRQRKHAE